MTKKNSNANANANAVKKPAGTFREVGSFEEDFINLNKEGESFEGSFVGFMEKEIDKEKREFGVFLLEGNPKKQIIGGRDLLGKLKNVKEGDWVRVTFLEKDTFTPKGTKKKLPIRRYRVEVLDQN